MNEPGAELETPDRSLSDEELDKTLDQLDATMISALASHPVALDIYQNEHSPEEQMSDSIEVKDPPTEEFPNGREWKCVVSFTRGELAVKLFPNDDPLTQSGFFTDLDRSSLDYRKIENGTQIKFHNSVFAASNSLGLASQIEVKLGQGE